VNAGGVQLQYTVTQAAAGPPAPTIAGAFNSANYSTGTVSPGEIVAIFGQNMGPATGVGLQISNGALTTSLGGTQVLFDGVPSPMVYSRNTQVNAVVPFAVAGKSITQMQVSYNGATSDAMSIPVQDTTPAIYTQDGSGRGPGAVLNQDFMLNTSAVPAARGSVVAIYCTGGGTMSPIVGDGAVIGATLPNLTAVPVAVTIGGFDAKVSYAGGVPASIAGLVQINAEVPAGVTPGSTVPMTVRVGSSTSSAGVTIAVK
jgi:uncharacterized protein (TIGR03437 family)